MYVEIKNGLREATLTKNKTWAQNKLTLSNGKYLLTDTSFKRSGIYKKINKFKLMDGVFEKHENESERIQQIIDCKISEIKEKLEQENLLSNMEKGFNHNQYKI